MSNQLARRIVARHARLRFDRHDWQELIAELGARGEGRREAGAFLLAPREGETSRVSQIVFLDDLDPDCLNGAIHFHGEAYGELWNICDRESMGVLADVHSHPGKWVGQSSVDAENPMVAKRGHLGLIVPGFATRAVAPADVGVHEYRGEEGWVSWFGRAAKHLLYVGRFA